MQLGKGCFLIDFISLHDLYYQSRNIPLLDEGSDSMAVYPESFPYVLFFQMKRHKAKPVNDDAADVMIRSACGNQVSLVQQTFYNRPHDFVGANVQYALEAGEICYSFTCPLHRHDEMASSESSILPMQAIP